MAKNICCLAILTLFFVCVYVQPSVLVEWKRMKKQLESHSCPYQIYKDSSLNLEQQLQETVPRYASKRLLVLPSLSVCAPLTCFCYCLRNDYKDFSSSIDD